MKTLLIALSLGITISLAVNIADAKPFNDRGIDWKREAVNHRSPDSRPMEYTPTGRHGFNDRGKNWVRTITLDAADDKCVPRSVAANLPRGFQDKSFIEFRDGVPLGDRLMADKSINADGAC